MGLVIQDSEQYNMVLTQACNTSPRIQLLITEWPRLYTSCTILYCDLMSIQSCQYTSGKTYLPCQVGPCQNMLDKAFLTYSGRNMLGKRLHCHSAHVMADKYHTRHDNIVQSMKWYLRLKESSAWSMFLAFHMGLVPEMFLSFSLTTLLFHNAWSIELPSHTLHISLQHQIVLP